MNSDKLVVNASPIISLARINQADLLLGLASELVIPRGVFDEIMAHDVVDSAIRWVSDRESSLVRTVEIPPLIAEWNLGKGEAEVIAFAYQRRDFVVSIDDRAAKRCAESFSISVRGTIALLVDAKRKRLIPEAGPLLLRLKANGFRVSEPVLAAALMLAGES
jgi:predicted nucleic acid-binding protein